VLFIEYDVTRDGEIILVALVNAVDEDGLDPDGSAWMRWRTDEFGDDGLGCVGVDPADLALMERTDDPTELRTVVERIILTDRAAKEQAPA
jgi:hypothetical protein